MCVWAAWIVRDVPNDDLRGAVAIVTQEIQLFSATVRDNLTFFDSSIPDAQIMAALDELEMGDWVRGLPKGLDTLMATGGTGFLPAKRNCWPLRAPSCATRAW